MINLLPVNLLPIFLITAILVGVKWYLMVSICISLITNDIEHLLNICVSSLEKFNFTF